METELIAKGQSMAIAFRQFADLLENENFIRKALELDGNPELKEVARHDPRAYFREQGIHIPSTIKVTIGSIIICWDDGKHGWCILISRDGIVVESY
jgi:hypothetical protein